MKSVDETVSVCDQSIDGSVTFHPDQCFTSETRCVRVQTGKIKPVVRHWVSWRGTRDRTGFYQRTLCDHQLWIINHVCLTVSVHFVTADSALCKRVFTLITVLIGSTELPLSEKSIKFLLKSIPSSTLIPRSNSRQPPEGALSLPQSLSRVTWPRPRPGAVRPPSWRGHQLHSLSCLKGMNQTCGADTGGSSHWEPVCVLEIRLTE